MSTEKSDKMQELHNIEHELESLDADLNQLAATQEEQENKENRHNLIEKWKTFQPNEIKRD